MLFHVVGVFGVLNDDFGMPQHYDCSFTSSYPQQYVVHKTTRAPLIDGKLDDKAWTEAAWTNDFVDISTNDIPRFRTRAKMRWDDAYLYVGVLMEEPQVLLLSQTKYHIIVINTLQINIIIANKTSDLGQHYRNLPLRQ